MNSRRSASPQHNTTEPGKLTPFGILGGILDVFVDVGEEMNEAIDRSEYAFARGLFSMRRAVTELFESELRGPGIFFAHSGFGPENAVFGDDAFVHEGYRAERNDNHPVSDARYQDRLDARIARIRFIGRLDEAIGRIVLAKGPTRDGPTKEDLAFLRQLRDDLSGPTSVRDALSALLEDFSNDNRDAALRALDREQGLIRTARIASFIHPNEAGARRYAKVIAERYARHRRLRIGAEIRRLAARPGVGDSAPVRVAATLRGYGLDPARGLRACFQHVVVDSLAVETVTARTANIAPLGLGSPPRALRVEVGPDLAWTVANLGESFAEAGARDLFCIDTRGQLHLWEIDRLALRAGAPVIPDVELASVTLHVNGKVVFQADAAKATRDGDRLVFNYPAR